MSGLDEMTAAPSHIGPEPPRARNVRRSTLVTLVEQYALPGILVLLVILFAVLPQTRHSFTTSANLRALVSNQAVIALVAIASIVPLIAGQIDLSAAPTAGMTGLIAAGLASNYGWGVGPIIVTGLVAGAIVGAVNAFLVAYAGIGSIIVTLGTSTLIQAFVSWYSKDETIVSGIPSGLLNIGRGNLLGIPRTVYYVIVVSVVIYYILQQTPFGRHLYFVGANARASELVGLPIRRLTASSFIFSGVLSGAAGLLQVAVAGSASPQVGPGFTLPALAAVFLGATAIRPGRFNVGGTLVAVLFVAVIVNGLTLLGAADWLQPAVDGASLIAAVTIATVAGRRRQAS
jgi:ribose transport system permease protein